MEEEDFAIEAAEILEREMDIEEVDVPEASNAILITMSSGERFKIKVRKLEDDED